MIYERGRVIRRSGCYAFVSSEGQRACVRCAAGRGCGGGLMARVLDRRLFEVQARVGEGALKVGDEVLMGIHGHALLRAAALVYVVPIIGLAVGAWVGAVVGEVWSVSGALVGFATGLLLVRALSRYLRGSPGWEPIVVRALGR